MTSLNSPILKATTNNASSPPGFLAISSACQRLYPSQKNPLQVSAVVKFWLGGPDPLDYISMYLNQGAASKQIPEHWHYISFGLSDLYGDGRVHPIPETVEKEAVSGFGFELTFRLKREPGELTPPTWPAKLMQTLAQYICNTSNVFAPGDHVSWHRPLDGGASRVEHMLMAEDPQLASLTTEFGKLTFIQIVGICKEELEAAQHWNGRGVLELLRSRSLKMACGPFWVTDVGREHSIFEIDHALTASVEDGIDKDGSDLSGVSCRCRWKEAADGRRSSRTTRWLNPSENFQVGAGSPRSPLSSPDMTCNFTDHLNVRFLNAAHLTFDLEAGSLLHLALYGRLMHGRHFTFRSVLSEHAVTFVAPGVHGALADAEKPFAVIGTWLQVFLSDQVVRKISEDIRILVQNSKVAAPRVFAWPGANLSITVSNESMLFS